MKSKIVSLIILASMFTSCFDDFLQRDPLDFGSQELYFKSVQDLQQAANRFYTLFPGHEEYKFMYTTDSNSDDMCRQGTNNNFLEGERRAKEDGDSDWKFNNIRDCCTFIALIKERMDKNEITGSEALINHALGEFYFFRAYEHYRLLKVYGDAPIIREVQRDDYEELQTNSTRQPRNEVARFIIEDLEEARRLMQDKSPEIGRLNKDCATLLLARVALFEATWEKYHAGTALAPGNPKWVGNALHPNFVFKAGSVEAEVNFFLDKAIVNAEMVASARPKLHDDYAALFNTTNTETISEMILAKKYKEKVIRHSVGRHLLAGSSGVGFTRAFVNSCLMTNGLPIYADPNFYTQQRDTSLYTEMINRDYRLLETVQFPEGIVNRPDSGGLIRFSIPHSLLASEETSCPTGYSVRKYHLETPDQNKDLGISTSDSPIFRAAEAYLIYLEAYYERNGLLGGNCDAYWKELRRRAKVNTEYMVTINATDLDKEDDLAVWSRSIEVSPTLYNIRRERRNELGAEGFRLDDLRRWRSLDMMNIKGNKNTLPTGDEDGYIMAGMDIWTAMWTRFDQDKMLKPGAVSPETDGDRILPHRRYSDTKGNRGYNFPKPHYLEPIPLSQILICSPDGTPANSYLYQSPGWANDRSAPCDLNYDCD